jgi:hypothetical protein
LPQIFRCPFDSQDDFSCHCTNLGSASTGCIDSGRNSWAGNLPEEKLCLVDGFDVCRLEPATKVCHLKWHVGILSEEKISVQVQSKIREKRERRQTVSQRKIPPYLTAESALEK